MIKPKELHITVAVAPASADRQSRPPTWTHRLLGPSDQLCEFSPGEFVCLDWRQFQALGRDLIDWLTAQRKIFSKRRGRIEPCIISVGSSATNAESMRREAHRAGSVGIVYYPRPSADVPIERIARQIASELSQTSTDFQPPERLPRLPVRKPSNIEIYANPPIQFSDDDMDRLFAPMSDDNDSRDKG